MSNLYKKYNISNPSQASLNQYNKSTFMIFNGLYSEYLGNDKSIHILDVGCGDGMIIKWLHSIGFRNVEGVDISSQQVEICKESGLDVKCSDVFSYINQAGKVPDLIIMRDVLEHMTLDEIEDFLGIIKSLGGAKLVIQTPNAESFTATRNLYGDATHVRIFTWHSIKQIFSASEWEDIEIREVFIPIFNIKSLIFFMLAKLSSWLYMIVCFMETGSVPKIATRNMLIVANGKK
jgi:2-polyprenyl-3-methyl-5-hydroxy-6-metoxy-1,4-benzoquinol methylase